jgi:hypothetical protein
MVGSRAAVSLSMEFVACSSERLRESIRVRISGSECVLVWIRRIQELGTSSARILWKPLLLLWLLNRHLARSLGKDSIKGEASCLLVLRMWGFQRDGLGGRGRPLCLPGRARWPGPTGAFRPAGKPAPQDCMLIGKSLLHVLIQKARLNPSFPNQTSPPPQSLTFPPGSFLLCACSEALLCLQRALFSRR